MSRCTLSASQPLSLSSQGLDNAQSSLPTLVLLQRFVVSPLGSDLVELIDLPSPPPQATGHTAKQRELTRAIQHNSEEIERLLKETSQLR